MSNKFKTAGDFNIGERVTHINHGDGSIWGYGDFSDEIFVDFDIEPDGWEKILCVSPQCLQKI